MLDSAPVGITLSRDDVTLYVNRACLDMFRFENLAELAGRPIIERIAPEYREQLAERIQRRSRGEIVPDSYDAVGLRKDGSTFSFHADVTSIELEDGQATLAFFTDISERKATELALRESERRFRDTLESAQLVSVLLDLEGRVTFCNDYLADLTGYRKADIIGQPWFDVFIPPDKAAAGKRSFFENIKRGQIPAHDENEILTRQGERRLISWNSMLLRDLQGNLIGTSSIGNDLTEHRKGEKERLHVLQRERAARADAEAANRMKDDFLATLSHELRTPLTAMLGWARLLRSGDLDQETSARAVETIESNAHLQAQLIEDLLDVSRIMMGKLRLGVRPVDLALVIEASLDAVRPAAKAKSIRLLRTLDPATGFVSGDPDRLQQVVWNLLSNAVKFTPANGQVEVILEKLDSFAQITVRDTGKGIRAEFLPHVFDRFRQADSSSTRVHGGLGLGLAIVRSLVELHGGTVHAESPGEGKGATFFVRLQLMGSQDPHSPLALRFQPHSPGTEEFVEPVEAPNLEGLQILVLSDEPVEREFLIAVFKQQGAQVTPACSVTEAKALMKRSAPDVFISDFELASKTQGLLEQLQDLSRRKTTPILAVAILDESPEACEDEHFRCFQAHLTRPIDPLRLATLVASAALPNRQPSQS
jgi:PAS domain S-box-containing protein